MSPAHSDSVWGVAWTRNETLDQELIISGSVDNTVRVWAWSAPPTHLTTITLSIIPPGTTPIACWSRNGPLRGTNWGSSPWQQTPLERVNTSVQAPPTHTLTHPHSGGQQWSGWVYQGMGSGDWGGDKKYRWGSCRRLDTRFLTRLTGSSGHTVQDTISCCPKTLQFIATGSHNGKINLFSLSEGRKTTALDTRGKFIMSVTYVSHMTVT